MSEGSGLRLRLRPIVQRASEGYRSIMARYQQLIEDGIPQDVAEAAIRELCDELDQEIAEDVEQYEWAVAWAVFRARQM